MPTLLSIKQKTTAWSHSGIRQNSLRMGFLAKSNTTDIDRPTLISSVNPLRYSSFLAALVILMYLLRICLLHMFTNTWEFWRIPLRKIVLHSLLLIVTAVWTQAADYYVAVDGFDSNPGTIQQPLRTIGSAARKLQAGDTCWIRGGVYRETIKLTGSGQQDKPIAFARYQAEQVIVDGSDLVPGPWTVGDNGIWKTKIAGDRKIEAVFCQARMMIEARWPNCSWEENWDADKKWALTEKGSKLGEIECPELGSSNQDLSGGLLYLKLSKGNNCFTRPITDHHTGSNKLEYDRTGIEGRAWNEDSMPERIKKFGFEQNRFFVTAKGALDAAGEWWHDAEQSELLFVPPGNGSDDPNRLEVSVKTRIAGFEGEGVSDIAIEGIEFRGCNLRLDECRRLSVRNCRFVYPSTPKIFPDGKTALEMQRNLRVTGEDNVLERLLIEWAVDGALEVEGSGNRIENCIVHDSNLHGRHPGPAISVRGRVEKRKASASHANMISHCTVYNVGGVGIYAQGSGPAIAEFNHVFNAGLYCADISSLYVPVGKEMAGTVVHHNWLHDISGIGFRVDIQGRGITVHHNLVWNVSVGCKLQGYQLAAYNNTVLTHDATGGFIVVFEPDATPAEISGWHVRNNVVNAFYDRLSLRNDPRKTTREFVMPLTPVDGAIDHNVIVQGDNQSQLFVDLTRHDFRPKPSGPLDGTGVVVEGITNSVQGTRPTIGALEPATSPWHAGSNWMNDGLKVPASPAEATELAKQLRPASIQLGKPNRRYEDQ